MATASYTTSGNVTVNLRDLAGRSATPDLGRLVSRARPRRPQATICDSTSRISVGTAPSAAFQYLGVAL